MYSKKIIGHILGFIYDIIGSTYRYRFHFSHPGQRREVLDEFNSRGTLKKPSIIGSFHQDDFSTIRKFTHRDIGVLVSPSDDGEILAQALSHMGFHLVRGSDNKKPIGGFIAAMRFIRKGYKFAIAIDGPRGPYGDVKEGIIRMSEKTGSPIIPMASLPTHYWELHRSWNRPRIPKPFSRVDIMIGEKKIYTRDELKDTIYELKNRLNKI